MTDLEKHVNQPGRAKLVKKVRDKINELGIDDYNPFYSEKGLWADFGKDMLYIEGGKSTIYFGNEI